MFINSDALKDVLYVYVRKARRSNSDSVNGVINCPNSFLKDAFHTISTDADPS